MNFFNVVAKRFALAAAAAALMTFTMAGAAATPKKVKIGLLLPYSGTYGMLGTSVDRGLRLAIEQHGSKLGGREVEFVVVNSEADPGKAVSNMQKLISAEKVDFVVGPIHSGVAMAALKVARQAGTILVIPNAGLNVATRELCAPNIFRTSFSNWQPNYAMAKPAYDQGYRRIVTISWRYAAGTEHLGGFEEEFKRYGGQIVKQILVPFPSVDFQAYLTEIAAIKPDAVYTFFGGGGAMKFIQDYADAGLKGKIPLLSTGFLTESLEGLGNRADGIRTTLHYADDLDNKYNIAFRKAFKDRYNDEAGVYAVQGYDSGLLLIRAMEAVKGNTSDRTALIDAMSKVKFQDSPRGPWTMSKAHNPIQNVYMSEVRGGKNVMIGTAARALEDPATGCKMAK